MKKIIPLALIAIWGIAGIGIAQTVSTRIDNINVNLDNNQISITNSDGYYGGTTNSWIPDGVSNTKNIYGDAYNAVITQINLNGEVQVLQNVS
jgi:hypothetical protein